MELVKIVSLLLFLFKSFTLLMINYTYLKNVHSRDPSIIMGEIKYNKS